MCQNSNFNQTQKLKLDKTQKLKSLPNLNDKSHYMTKDTIKGSFSKNILTPWQPMRCSLVSLLSQVTEACGSPKMSFIASWPHLDDQLEIWGNSSNIEFWSNFPALSDGPWLLNAYSDSPWPFLSEQTPQKICQASLLPKKMNFQASIFFKDIKMYTTDVHVRIFWRSNWHQLGIY